MTAVKTAGIRKPLQKIRRPKLLFLAYSFPPLRVIACVRTRNIAKHLARLGWEVTVVTPYPFVWRNSDDPEKISAELEKEGIRRIFTEHRWRFLRPQNLICWSRGPAWFFGGLCRRLARWLQIDRTIGWVKAAELACDSLTPKDVDVILATGSPFSSFRLARRLSQKLGRPYVLDYRDPWTENPHVPSRPRAKIIEEEQRLLAECAAAIVVSPSWAEAMERRFNVGEKLRVITNGYDAEEMSKVKPYNFGHFAMVYTGRFYPPKRIITPVISALKAVKETTKGKYGDWYFHYYGTQQNHVRDEAVKFGILDRVVLHGNVPRAEALAAVRGANIAIVVISAQETPTKDIAGMIPAKLFESLALKTPTLIVGPLGTDIDTIVEVGGMAHRFSGRDVESMKSFILDVMSGQTPPAKNIEVYAWETIREKLNEVLRAAMGTPAGEKKTYASNHDNLINRRANCTGVTRNI